MEYGFWDVIKLLGALGIFIYGMKVMSDGIQKVAGGKLKRVLHSITKNRFFGVLSGFSITAVIQSSSSTTVMVVSFVNAGLLTVRQAISVIMGANIGTTITAWIITIVGFKMKMDYIAMPLVIAGIPLLFSNSRRNRALGEFFIGFCILFLGLGLLKHSVPDLKGSPEVIDWLQSMADSGLATVLLFVLIGTVITIIVQSSSAAMGITLALVSGGLIPFEVAAAMILGENIGTTITANIAAVVGNTNAKRAARAHLIFNLIGVFWILCIFPFFIQLVDWVNLEFFNAKCSLNAVPTDLSDTKFLEAKGSAVQFGISVFHSLFNIANTLIMIWFVPQIERLVNRLVRSQKGDKGMSKMLGRNVVDAPEVMVLEARKEIAVLGHKTAKILDNTFRIMDDNTKKKSKLMAKIEKGELTADDMEVEITAYLSEASQSDISAETSNEIIKLLAITSEIEQMSDTCQLIAKRIEQKDDNDLKFKSKMDRGLKEYSTMLQAALDAFLNDLEDIDSEVNHEQLVMRMRKLRELKETLSMEHLSRIGKKEDSIPIGIIYRDILMLLDRLYESIYSAHKQLSAINSASA